MQNKKTRGRPKGDRPPKKLVSFKFQPEFIEHLTRAAYWSRTSVTAILEEWGQRGVEDLQRRHNKGKPFAQVPEDQ
jgi:uncharacterized protein (DUF4415 family)